MIQIKAYAVKSGYENILINSEVLTRRTKKSENISRICDMTDDYFNNELATMQLLIDSMQKSLNALKIIAEK